MEFKIIEIRDRLTTVEAMAIRMRADTPTQQFYLRRVGFGGSDSRIVLMRLSDQEAHSDSYDWKLSNGRTMGAAQEWIQHHFDELTDGDVVDIEYIYGEATKPKLSERFVGR